MVDELAKIPVASSHTPGDNQAKVFRDWKWTFPEAAKPKAPSQPTLDADHKKQRQSAVPSVTAKQLIELVSKLANDEISKLGVSLLKRCKLMKDQAAPSSSTTKKKDHPNNDLAHDLLSQALRH